MSEIKVNGNLFKKATAILKKNHTTFGDQFNKLMDQGVKLDQVPFGFEEYDTKDTNDYSIDLGKLNVNVEHKFIDVLKSMDIPMTYVVNGYCRRVILKKGVPSFHPNFTSYK
ncbi:MAG: hypothetical protein AJITA_00717 [Acetilactobacillus jinshanensis]